MHTSLYDTGSAKIKFYELSNELKIY